MERQRQSIPIQGINRAESDDTVKDGACEDIYNFRYRAGVFENVRQPLLLHPITQSNGFSIVHRLDAMDQGEYLAEKEGALWRVKISDGTVTGLEKITVLPGNASDTRYFHFGNVLYVNYTQGGVLQELVFRYKEGKITRVDFASLAPPRLDISCEYKSAPKETFGTESDSNKPTGVRIAYTLRYPDDPAKNEDKFYYNVGIEALTEEGYIPGTAYLFAAYKLFDGSIIKPSALCVITSDRDPDSPQYLYNAFYAYTDHTSSNYFGRVAGVKPTLQLTVPQEAVDNELIESVILFSTRNVPTYNYDQVQGNFGKNGFTAIDIYENRPITPIPDVYQCSHGCIWNEELDELSGPFYEIEELDFRAGKTNVTLSYKDHYEHVENGALWEPNYSSHSTVSTKKIDYNDRLHVCDLKTKLFAGFNPFFGLNDKPGSEYEGYTYYDTPLIECGADWTILVNGEKRIVRTEVMGHYWQNGKNRLLFVRNLLFYPDSRAQKVDIWVRDKSGLLGVKGAIRHESYDLVSESSTNSAFRLIKSSNYITGGTGLVTMYNNDLSAFHELSGSASDYDLPGISDVNKSLIEPNKLQVSYPSNPFVCPPANIYTVGGQGERIREIIATAERMTEVAYGYQPLLVFTNRATYALESGEGEVLYARNIPILSQSIVEGTNAVEGNGAVFFVSTSGVTVIVRGHISNVSEQMRRWAGLIASDATLPDFEKYIRAARLMFNRNESELIVYNPSYNYAYVYSLLGKYWTRREWDASVESCFGEIITASGVASLFEEDPERPASSCKLVTRPLKFGSLEYTRLETLAARIRWGEGSRFTLSIEGSDDGMRWVPLRAESNQPSIRRTSSSFRYHRIQLAGSVADCLAITHFDVEFYNKFVHRLR